MLLEGNSACLTETIRLGLLTLRTFWAYIGDSLGDSRSSFFILALEDVAKEEGILAFGADDASKVLFEVRPMLQTRCRQDKDKMKTNARYK